MPSWLLADANLAQVRDARYEVAVLPFGATEPHNLHLPYGTDTREGDVIGGAICAAAHDAGACVVLLPTIPYGTETNMRAFPLALNLDPSTLALVTRDLVASIADAGIAKILLLNMHGGNELKPIVRELAGRVPAHLFVCNWWEVIADVYDEIFDAPEDHAGEAETSIALAAFPDLVARTEGGGLAADAGATRPFRFEAMRRGWVKTSRPWHLLTTSSGSGNPHAATAEKGERLIAVLVERIAPFVVELSEAPLDDTFPFVASGDDRP